MSRIAVVYDRGSASLREIVAGLSGLAEVCFLVPDSAHVRELKPLVREFGTLVEGDAAGRFDLDAVGRLNIDAVITFSERMLLPAADIAATLGLLFHSPNTARLLRVKSSQRHRLEEHGVASAKSRRLYRARDFVDVARKVGLPVVVKPDLGEASAHTFRIDDTNSGQRVAENWFASTEQPLVVEEFLQGRDSRPFGDYVSVESVVSHGHVSTFAVTGKYPLVPPFREPGSFWPSTLSVDEERAVVDLTRHALTALGVRVGITHTEIKLTPDGPRIIEVNGRLGGHVNELSRRADGRDLVTVAGLLALGEQVECLPVKPQRVYFQYSNLAPTAECRLDEVRGARRVRSVPGVTGYRLFLRPGMNLDGGVLTTEIDQIQGDAPDHLAMLRVIAQAVAELEFMFSIPGVTKIPR